AAQQSLEQIQSAVDHGRAVIADVAAVTEGREEGGANIDFAALIEQVQRLLLVRLPRTVTLHPELTQAPTGFYAAPGHLRQILINLVDNAIRAGARVIQLHVSGLDIDNDNRMAGGPPVREGRYVALTVADDGHGVREEHRARLFEPFFTTAADGGGTGLGLPIVKSLADRYHGTVTVESEVNVGTRVSVFLRSD
ncbi:MAG: ATP-binding protein, partial [Pseudomonadota bacterium]